MIKNAIITISVLCILIGISGISHAWTLDSTKGNSSSMSRADYVLDNMDSVRDGIMDAFEPSNIPPALRFLIAGQKANIFIEEKFFVCLVTSKDMFQSLEKEACADATIDITIRKKALVDLEKMAGKDDFRNSDVPEFILEEKDKGNIAIEAKGTVNKLKLGAGEILGKAFFKVSGLLSRIK